MVVVVEMVGMVVVMVYSLARRYGGSDVNASVEAYDRDGEYPTCLYPCCIQPSTLDYLLHFNQF